MFVGMMIVWAVPGVAWADHDDPYWPETYGCPTHGHYYYDAFPGLDERANAAKEHQLG